VTEFALPHHEIHAAATAVTDTHTGFRDDRGVTR
jgi:hypothetical protein